MVSRRMKEFGANGAMPEEQLFSELCFCILTANFNAERSMRIQHEIGRGFITLPAPSLAKKLKKLGHRFPNARARYIAEARKHRNELAATLASAENDAARREWLVENILGLGYKEASHFMRNIGFSDVAIIDFHIIDLLARHRIIKKPSPKPTNTKPARVKTRSLSRKRYLEIERILGKIASRSRLSQGELDLYLWYMETGKVLK